MHSTAETYGMFAYIIIYNCVNYKNHINESSITHNIRQGKNSYYGLHLSNDHILCPSVNLTNSYCYRYPALCFSQACNSAVS